jgi:hypothetical protein
MTVNGLLKSKKALHSKKEAPFFLFGVGCQKRKLMKNLENKVLRREKRLL